MRIAHMSRETQPQLQPRPELHLSPIAPLPYPPPSLPVRMPIQLNSLIVLLYLQILPNEPKDTKTNAEQNTWAISRWSEDKKKYCKN